MAVAPKATGKAKEDSEDEKATFADQQREALDAELRKGFDPNLTYIRGQLTDFCQRLLKSWTLSLKAMKRDLHAEEYSKRHADQDKLLELLTRARAYSNSINKDGDELENMAMLALQELELRHAIYEPKLNVLDNPDHPGHSDRARKREAHSRRVLSLFESDDCEVVKLAKIVWRTPNETHAQQCTQATLYVVFWLALHNDYRNARDLLQASHLSPHNVDGYIQDAGVKWYIGMCEPETQAIFNRCIARTALAAFAHGNFSQCLKMFSELCHSMKIKELMAQHVKIDWWKREKTRDEEEIEFAEKMRLLPEHLHFNTDMMESVHFTCAMFEEIPLWLTNKNRRNSYSKSFFRKFFENYLKKDMTGPSSNTRWTIMEAGKSMSMGDWRMCYKLIAELKFWNEMQNVDSTRELVKAEIKKHSLRCYLEQFGPTYKSIRMQLLCERFELDRLTVQRFISGFCIEHDLPARYDQIAECYVVTRGNPTPIQKLGLSYMDKFDQFMEMNQKLAPGSFRHRNKGNSNRNQRQENSRRDRRPRPRTGGQSRWR